MSKLKRGDTVEAIRTMLGQVNKVVGEFNGYRLYNMENPNSIVGTVFVREDARCYDVYPDSIVKLADKLTKFEQALFDCAWNKVTCKPSGETKEEYIKRWAEQILTLAREEIENRNLGYNAGLKDGHQSCLNNMPKWQKINGACGGNAAGVPTFLIRTAPGYYHTSPCIGPGDTFIRLTDLEKLPFSD